MDLGIGGLRKMQRECWDMLPWKPTSCHSDQKHGWIIRVIRTQMSVTIRNKLHFIFRQCCSLQLAWCPCDINSTPLTRAPREGQGPSIQILNTKQYLEVFKMYGYVWLWLERTCALSFQLNYIKIRHGYKCTALRMLKGQKKKTQRNWATWGHLFNNPLNAPSSKHLNGIFSSKMRHTDF